MPIFCTNHAFTGPETNGGSHPFPTEDYIEISDDETAVVFLSYQFY